MRDATDTAGSTPTWWARSDTAGSGAERGQIIIIGALLMALLFVMLAVVVNAGIYAGAMANDVSEQDTDDAIQAYHQTEHALADSVENANANHATDHAALTRNLTADLEATELALAEDYATTGASYAISAPTVTNRTVIVQDNASRNFTDATAATRWTPIDGVDATADYTMVVDRDGLPKPDSADRFRLTITNGTVTWELGVTHNRTTDDIELDITTPSGSNTCAVQNETATVDLVDGTLESADCPDLAFGEFVDGPYEVRYANADNVTGEYDATFTEANGVSATAYADGTDSPRANASIASATVSFTYETAAISHDANVTAP